MAREKPTLLEENVALHERVRDLEGQLQERTEELANAREDRPQAIETLVERLVDICLTYNHSLEDVIRSGGPQGAQREAAGRRKK